MCIWIQKPSHSLTPNNTQDKKRETEESTKMEILLIEVNELYQTAIHPALSPVLGQFLWLQAISQMRSKYLNEVDFCPVVAVGWLSLSFGFT
jgi:hypothetical protein